MRPATEVLSREDQARASALCDQLATYRIGGPSALDLVLPELRDWLGADIGIAYRVRGGPHGWQLDMAHAVGRSEAKLRERLGVFLKRVEGQFGAYDPARPQRDQRNRSIDSIRL